MTEEKNSSQKEEQAKNSGWKKINKKFVLLSFFFLFIGFIGGYQVSGMNNQAGTRQPRANQLENSDDQNNTMENGRPDQRELASDRSNGEESDTISGATESEEDQLESGSTTNQSNNTSATEDII